MSHYNPEKRAWKGRSYKKGGERVRDLKEAVKTAGERALTDYVDRFVTARGARPRLVVAVLPDLQGYPVRNADGGVDIAHFLTPEAAEAAVVQADREAKALLNGSGSGS